MKSSMELSVLKIVNSVLPQVTLSLLIQVLVAFKNQVLSQVAQRV